MKDMREEGREMKEQAERAMETSRRINNFAAWLKTATTVTADQAFAEAAALAHGDGPTHAALERLVRAKFPGKSASKARHARTSRRNGKLGGRPTKDEPGDIAEAVKEVRRMQRSGLSMKRACELAIKNAELSIGVDGLERHVRT